MEICFEMYFGDRAIQALEGSFLKPSNFTTLENQRIVKGKHYVKIICPVICFGRKIETLVAVDLFEKLSRHWASVRQNISFEKLQFYEGVDEKDLPWNNGEELFWNTIWARMPMKDVYRILN